MHTQIINKTDTFEPQYFKPQFKLVLTCSHAPLTEQQKKEENAVWRRVNVIPFISDFTFDEKIEI